MPGTKPEPSLPASSSSEIFGVESSRSRGALSDYRSGKIARLHHSNEVIRKVQSRMQLDVWHMATDAVACLPLICMKC
jgi:hypothetical protein